MCEVAPYSEASKKRYLSRKKFQEERKGYDVEGTGEYPRVLDGIMPGGIQAYAAPAAVLLLLQ